MSVAVILPWPLWCALAVTVFAVCFLLRRAYLAELARTPSPPPDAVTTPAEFYLIPLEDTP